MQRHGENFIKHNKYFPFVPLSSFYVDGIVIMMMKMVIDGSAEEEGD